MFRSSIFNYYTIVNGKSVIFNSMNEKIVRFNQKDVSSEEKLLDFFAVSSEKNRRLLIEQGLIVKCDANEEQIASIKLLDRVVNNDLYLTIMPTYGCNFRCIYCYENQCDSRTDNFPSISMGDDVQASIIRYVKKKLSEHYCLVVEWHGGEPLLRTDIIDSLSQKLISVAMRSGKPYVATITTNGYYLTEDVVKLMLKNHVVKFHVTVDGFSWNHDYYRPDSNNNPTFKIVMDNLLRIKHKIKQKNFHVVLRTNVTQRFLPYLGRWLEYLSENFSDDKRFQIYIKMVEDKGGNAVKKIASDLLKSEDVMYRVMVDSKYKNNYEYYFSSIQSLFGSFDDIYDMLISSEYYLDYSPFYYHLISRGCISSSRNTYVIAPDCTIMKCTVGLDKDENKVGYITEKGEAIIDYYKLSKWIHYKRHPQSRCANCERGNICVNFACPKVNNFPDEGIDCTRNYVNTEKIVRLLSRGNYSFIKQY